VTWRKLGLVFASSGQHPWMQSHASSPVALSLGSGKYRVYFASRDAQNRSHISYIVFDVNSPNQVLQISPDYVLGPGPLGYFDDHGAYAASLVSHGNNLYMYYIGWNPGIREPLFYASIGLAVSEDAGLTFHKMFASPILGRSEVDPCFVSGPFVMIDNGIWRMWYVSGFRWEQTVSELHSYYHIKYAESTDGIHWQRDGFVCIDHKPGERNIARPCVVKEDGTYKMWYSYMTDNGYRIGYAESPDGYRWTRDDDAAGIDVSRTGWDSEEISYPWVFSAIGRRFMLYTGNQFSRGGVGLAVEVNSASRVASPPKINAATEESTIA
jgi:predicted GH43/DUF377 family glycosyl hydrolase